MQNKLIAANGCSLRTDMLPAAELQKVFAIKVSNNTKKDMLDSSPVALKKVTRRVLKFLNIAKWIS